MCYEDRSRDCTSSPELQLKEPSTNEEPIILKKDQNLADLFAINCDNTELRYFSLRNFSLTSICFIRENGGCTFCNCHVMAKDGTCLLEKPQPKFPDDISKESLQDILLKLEERD